MNKVSKSIGEGRIKANMIKTVTPVQVEIEVESIRFLLDTLKEVKEAKKEYPDLKVQIKVLSN